MKTWFRMMAAVVVAVAGLLSVAMAPAGAGAATSIDYSAKSADGCLIGFDRYLEINVHKKCVDASGRIEVIIKADYTLPPEEWTEIISRTVVASDGTRWLVSDAQWVDLGQGCKYAWVNHLGFAMCRTIGGPPEYGTWYQLDHTQPWVQSGVVTLTPDSQWHFASADGDPVITLQADGSTLIEDHAAGRLVTLTQSGMEVKALPDGAPPEVPGPPDGVVKQSPVQFPVGQTPGQSSTEVSQMPSSPQSASVIYGVCTTQEFFDSDILQTLGYCYQMNESDLTVVIMFVMMATEAGAP